MPKHAPPVGRNQEIILEITALGSEGQGIGRVQGYALFVPGALPAERVRALVIKPGKNYGVAKLLEVLQPAAERAFPPCPYFGRCGGCALQHMEYPAQLRFKRQVVEDAFGRIGGFEGISPRPVIGMENPWHYRNKGSFPFAMIDGRVECGFYAPRSHRLVPLAECCIQREPLLAAAHCVRDWANRRGISAYDEQSGEGLLRHVVARVSTAGDVMATVVATKALPGKKELLAMLQERVSGLRSIYWNHNPGATNAILGEKFELLWGRQAIEETVCGLRFGVGPASFLQVNPQQTERLYQTAMELLALEGSERVVDAYCGIGTISLLLAQRAGEVLGIESVPQAVEDARRNAQKNGIHNAHFLCGRSERELPRLAAEGYNPDALVLDPPRKGAEEAFLQAAVHSGARKIVYISCDPATLARDCKILHAGGYAIKAVQPVDMFAEGSGVETVVLLERG